MFKKHEETKQKFSIKKFKFGAASVLIATVFAAFAGNAQAEQAELASASENLVPSSTVVSEAPSTTEMASPKVSEEATKPSADDLPTASATELPSEAVTTPTSSEQPVTTSESALASSESENNSTSAVPTSATAEVREVAPKESVVNPTATEASAEVPTRVAATTYKVTYTDADTQQVVYQANKSVAEKTSLPKTEKVQFNVSVKSEVGSAPALEGYKLAEGQAQVQAAIVTENNGRKNLVNFNVVKDDQVAAGGNGDDVEGQTLMFGAASPAEVAANTRIGQLPSGEGIKVLQDPDNADQKFIFDTNKVFPVKVIDAGVAIKDNIGNVSYTAQQGVKYVFKNATTGQVLAEDTPTAPDPTKPERAEIAKHRPFVSVANVPGLKQGDKLVIEATNQQSGVTVTSPVYTVEKAAYDGTTRKSAFLSHITSSYVYATDTSVPVNMDDTYTDYADVYVGIASKDLNDSSEAHKLTSKTQKTSVALPEDWDKNNQMDYYAVARDANAYFWQVLGLYFVDNVKPTIAVSDQENNTSNGQTPEKVEASKATATADPRGQVDVNVYKKAFRDVDENQAIAPIYVETTATKGEFDKVTFRYSVNGEEKEGLPDGLTSRLVSRQAGRAVYVVEGTPTTAGSYTIKATAVDDKQDSELNPLYAAAGRPAKNNFGQVNSVDAPFNILVRDATPPVAPIVEDVIAGADTVPVKVSDDAVKFDVTYPNSKGEPVTVTYTKGSDGKYYTPNKEEVPVTGGYIMTPTPAGVNLPEGQHATAKAYDAWNNVSEEAQNNITNEAPVVYPPVDRTVSRGFKITDESLLAEARATDREDDSDGKDSTKPTIKITDKGGLNTDEPGVYAITFVAVDSQGKESESKKMYITVPAPPTPDKDKYTPTTDEIVVPQGSPITEDDVKKKVNIPEGSGGKIKEVGEIPSTDEPGKKAPVKVVVEYPDGTTDEVDVPVTVTPVTPSKPTPDKDKYTPTTDEIVVPQGSPITEDDVKKKVNIPEGSGGKIKEVGEIPSTDEPGKKAPVKVVVEYPDGTTDEVDVPVTVTPVTPSKPTPDKDKYTPTTDEIVVPQGSPITEDDVKKKVNIPEGSGGKIKEVGEIPSTDEPGKKAPVKVVVEYPDGTTDEVDVPVTVTPVTPSKPTPDKDKYTPTTDEIVVPQGSPITEDDVKKKVNIPEGSGGKIKEVGEIPSTDEPGKKAPVKVVVEYPDGTTDEVDVPVTVTPVTPSKPTPDKDKYTPTTDEIVVPQGSPITEDDVKKKVNIPEGSGGKIKEVGEIPSTDEPGKKAPVKVVVEYPDGTTDEVDVPVTVTPVTPSKPTPDKDKYTPTTDEIVVPQGSPITEDDVKKKVNIPEGSGGKIKEVGEIPSTDEPGKKAPVKVVVEYPDGTTDEVDVPVTVTPVTPSKPTPDKDKYTPTTDEIVVPQGSPITEDDVKKKVNIPEGSGGKIKEVGEIPSTDEPGKKAPVKVVVEYPDGTTDEVDVPVTVTPVTPSKPTPDKDKYTPTTDEIVVPQGSPITEDDVKKKVNIPEGSGGKIKEVGEIPSTDEPGKKAPVKVVVEYPDGTTDEVDVPVTVTPVTPSKPTPDKDKYTPTTDEIVVPQGSPITEDDVKKKVNIPEGSGGKIKEVGEIPSTDEPGKKAPVKVVVEYPDGTTDEVDVPVTVTPVTPSKPTPDKDKYTPTTDEIVVPQGSPITEDDVKKKVNIPEGSGGKIKEVGEIPSTDEPGKKAPVKVVVEYPDGTTDEVDVPVTVTPVTPSKPTPDKDKYTPTTDEIVVPQGSPITEDDVKKKVNIPEGSGGKIKEVGEIPSTDEPGKKAPVKVVVEYPDGTTDEVDVPVTVTPVTPSKPTPDKDKYTPTTDEIVVPQGSPITEDDVKKKVNIPEGSGGKIKEVGEIPSTDEPGKKAPVKVVVEYPDGTTDEVDVPVTVTPVTPSKPTTPKQPAGKKTTPVVPATAPAAPAAKPAASAQAQAASPAKSEAKMEVLPSTGTESTTAATVAGLGMILASLGFAGKRRRKED